MRDTGLLGAAGTNVHPYLNFDRISAYSDAAQKVAA
jgi:hypothetical protein